MRICHTRQNDVMFTLGWRSERNWVENYFWKLTWRMADITWETSFIEDQENFVVESVPFKI